MAKLENLLLLVQSLSKSEKRYFKLFSNLQEGEKDYQILFYLLDNQSINLEEIKVKFLKKCNNASFEIASVHLYQVLIKALINFEKGKSVETELLSIIQEIKILFDKSIYEECLKLVSKAKKLALKHEKYTYFLLIARLELQYITRLEFVDISEEELL